MDWQQLDKLCAEARAKGRVLPGDVVTVKLSGRRASILKYLDPEEYEEVDETIGKKYLVRGEDQRLFQIYDCEFTVTPVTL